MKINWIDYQEKGTEVTVRIKDRKPAVCTGFIMKVTESGLTLDIRQGKRFVTESHDVDKVALIASTEWSTDTDFIPLHKLNHQPVTILPYDEETLRGTRRPSKHR